MNRFLQNGRLSSSASERSYVDSNGLDLTLRLGLPGNCNDWAAAAAHQQQQQHQHYGNFVYVGPVTTWPIIKFEIPDYVGDMMNLPPVDYSLPQVFDRTISKPTVCYGAIHPGGQPELYWGYMTTTYLTVHLPPLQPPIRTHFKTGRTRIYVTRPHQCNNLRCQLRVTSRWRKGPFGPKTLCNSCGIEFKKLRDSIAAFVARRMEEITAATNIQMPHNL